jgi:hypothetical protein
MPNSVGTFPCLLLLNRRCFRSDALIGGGVCLLAADECARVTNVLLPAFSICFTSVGV